MTRRIFVAIALLALGFACEPPDWAEQKCDHLEATYGQNADQWEVNCDRHERVPIPPTGVIVPICALWRCDFEPAQGGVICHAALPGPQATDQEMLLNGFCEPGSVRDGGAPAPQQDSGADAPPSWATDLCSKLSAALMDGWSAHAWAASCVDPACGSVLCRVQVQGGVCNAVLEPETSYDAALIAMRASCGVGDLGGEI